VVADDVLAQRAGAAGHVVTNEFGSDPPTVQMLWDIEQIKVLKARYFRLLDTKDWDAFADLFTDDCRHLLPAAPGAVPKPPQTNDEYLANLRRTLADGITVHHGHMPEIKLLGPREAEGVWAMCDDVEIEQDSGETLRMQGYGHYHETYRKGDDGEWRISSKQNVRLRVDVLPPSPESA
jgi:hypothetical protein